MEHKNIKSLDTLCGQTYSAMVFLILICVPISILLIFMDKILVLAGQDPQIADVACKYSIWLIPALLASAILRPLIQYLQSQSFVLQFLNGGHLRFLYCYLGFYRIQNSKLQFFPYALQFHHCTILCHSELEQLQGHPQVGRLSVYAVMVLAIAEAVIVATALYCYRYLLGNGFSNEKGVVNYVAELVPLLSISVTMDSLHAVLSGVARGSGWQHIGAYVNLGAYYLVRIPLAVAMTVRERIFDTTSSADN
ncbi:hypothetical protein QYF36_014929 [Acer negundo]|nr:hypothetical protein QYF36_014929 [Acer negundo]